VLGDVPSSVMSAADAGLPASMRASRTADRGTFGSSLPRAPTSALTALSDPIRLRMLSAIAAERGEEVCACDLVELSGRSQPTVSHHMKILVDAGLVTREKRGLWVWYRIEPSRLDALRAVLT